MAWKNWCNTVATEGLVPFVTPLYMCSRDRWGSKLSTFLMQGIVVSHFFRQSKFFCTEISDFSSIGKCYNKFPLIWSSSPTQKPHEKYTPHKAGDYTNWHVFRSHNGSSCYICPQEKNCSQ